MVRFIHPTLVRIRQGWMNRTIHLVPTRNLQSIVIRQTPFDRRHGVGSIHIDSAGQAFTGGAPQLKNVLWEKLTEFASDLAQKAATTRYKT